MLCFPINGSCVLPLIFELRAPSVFNCLLSFEMFRSVFPFLYQQTWLHGLSLGSMHIKWQASAYYDQVGLINIAGMVVKIINIISVDMQLLYGIYLRYDCNYKYVVPRQVLWLTEVANVVMVAANDL